MATVFEDLYKQTTSPSYRQNLPDNIDVLTEDIYREYMEFGYSAVNRSNDEAKQLYKVNGARIVNDKRLCEKSER